MKIAYVVHDYTNSAGMERILSSKANYLVNMGLDVYIISNPPLKDKPFFFYDPRIHIIHLNSGAGKKSRKLYLEELYNCLQKIKPDISISTGMFNPRYLYEVKDGSKKILEIHFPKYNRKYWFATLDKYAIARFISDFYTREKTRTAKGYDKFIILTEEDKKSWRGLDNAQVISNALFPIPTEYSDNSSKKAITIARFAYQKGYEYLVEVWRLVIQKHPDWTLTTYGDGKVKKKIEKLIRERKLEKHLIIKDPIHNIYQALTDSSIYVMTSRYEGQPLGLMEAMACGLPAVSFACKCGPRDIITDGEDGFLIDFGDVKSCADKICQLIENQNLRSEMGKAGRKNILRYTQDNIMPQWIALFNELLKEEQ